MKLVICLKDYGQILSLIHWTFGYVLVIFHESTNPTGICNGKLFERMFNVHFDYKSFSSIQMNNIEKMPWFYFLLFRIPIPETNNCFSQFIVFFVCRFVIIWITSENIAEHSLSSEFMFMEYVSVCRTYDKCFEYELAHINDDIVWE